MNKYKIKFTIWKKGFMIEIYADSKELAVQKLKDYILKQTNIIDIEEVKDPKVESLKDIFKIK